MVEYLDGARIQGSSVATTDSTGAYQGWKEVGRTTTTQNSNSIQVSSLPNKKYFMILAHVIINGTTVSHVTLNGRTTSGDYSGFRIVNGSSSTETNSNRFVTTHSTKASNQRFIQAFITNEATKDKLCLLRCVESNATGDGDTLANMHGASRGYVATFGTNLSSIELVNDESGTFASGSELVVLAWDPTDTHTSGQFWDQLADVELGSAGGTLNSGTFTAKKYMWYQIYKTVGSGSGSLLVRMNSDTGNNYCREYEENGGTSAGHTDLDEAFATFPNSYGAELINGFMINSSGKEKISVCDNMTEGGTQSDYAHRSDFAWKWIRTESAGSLTTSGGTGNLLYSARRYGAKLVSGNSAIGTSVAGLAFFIQNQSYPSSDVFYYKVYRSDNGSGDADTSWTQVATTAGIPASEIPSSYDWLEKNFTSPVTLAVNDVVCIEADDVGSSSAYIGLGYAGSTPISNANVKGASRMQNESDQFTTTTSSTEATRFKILGTGNNSAQVTQINVATNSGTLGSGSWVKVWGHD